MPQKMQLKVLLSDAEKVVTISDGGLFLDVSSIQMFDANGAAVTDAGVVVTVGISADGLSYQSKVVSSNASLGGFEFKHIKVSVSGRTTASTVVVDVKVCSISEAMTSDSYKSRLVGLFTSTPYTADTLPDPATLAAGETVVVDGEVTEKTSSGLRPVGLPPVHGVIGRQRIFSFVGQSFSANYTVVNQVASKKKYIGMYLGYENYTATPYTLTAVTAGATPTHLSDGTNASIVDVLPYFPSAVVPAGSGSGNDIVPGILLSGFIPQAAIPRSDAPAEPYLHQIRTHCAASWSVGQLSSGATFAQWNAWDGNDDLKFASRAPTGNQTLSFVEANAPSEAGDKISPSFVVFVYEGQTCSLVSIGDSATKGHTATVNGLSWPYIAARDASSDKRYVACFNHAWTGQQHSASIARGKALIAAGIRPTVMTFFGWSGNDATYGSEAFTQTIFDLGFARVVDMVELCKANGIIPVVCLHPARSAFSATENARRMANNERLRGLLPETQVLDFDTVLTDPANNRQLNPLYAAVDGIHWNDAGITAAGEYAAPKIKLLVGA